MSTPPLVLGIDAGNTKTIALIADSQGTVLGQGRGGQSNIYVSKRDALAALEHAVVQALSHAGVSADRLSSAVLSATGADWPEDFVLLHAELESRGWGQHSRVVNDAVGALWAASGGHSGVMVVCGTSAGIAASNQGRVWHSSYWQEPEGAEQLGAQTLRAVYRAELGIDPPTALSAAVLRHFAARSVEAVLHHHTRRGSTASASIGRLARVLLDAADGGDPTALRLVRAHGEALGDYALAAARKVGLERAYSLMTAGGVMRHASPLLKQALLERVRQEHGGVTHLESRFEPVVGAVLLALEPLGGAGEGVRERLEATLPHASLFET